MNDPIVSNNFGGFDAIKAEEEQRQRSATPKGSRASTPLEGDLYITDDLGQKIKVTPEYVMNMHRQLTELRQSNRPATPSNTQDRKVEEEEESRSNRYDTVEREEPVNFEPYHETDGGNQGGSGGKKFVKLSQLLPTVPVIPATVLQKLTVPPIDGELPVAKANMFAKLGMVYNHASHGKDLRTKFKEARDQSFDVRVSQIGVGDLDI